jgi:hypothetical protein
MNWTDIRKILKDAPNEALLDILKGLYNLSPQNKAFIRTQLLPGRQDKELLEKIPQTGCSGDICGYEWFPSYAAFW